MSTPAAKALADRKVRRQKLFIAVGSVALLAIVGFQLPKLLGGGGGEETASSVPTVASSTPLPAATSGASTLPDTDRVVVQRGSGQLLSFGMFKSKDPFVQQLQPAEIGSALSATTPGAGKSGTTPTATVPLPGGGFTEGAPPTATGIPAPGSGTTSPKPAEPKVLLVTNGACEAVEAKKTFPTNEDVFRLVSIAKDKKSVEIGIVGGAYDNGQPTTTLKLGDKVTLVNTADGTTYVIELRSKCTAEEKAKAASATTVQTSTVQSTTAQTTTTPVVANPQPASTTTATTPIVTDTLDTTTTTTTSP